MSNDNSEIKKTTDVLTENNSLHKTTNVQNNSQENTPQHTVVQNPEKTQEKVEMPKGQANEQSVPESKLVEKPNKEASAPVVPPVSAPAKPVPQANAQAVNPAPANTPVTPKKAVSLDDKARNTSVETVKSQVVNVASNGVIQTKDIKGDLSSEVKTTDEIKEAQYEAIEERKGLISTFFSWVSTLPLKYKIVFVFIFVPSFFVFLYLMFMASDMYISETKFAVKSSSDSGSQLDMASVFFQMPNATTKEALIIETYIKSPDAFKKLDEKLHIMEHYSSHEYDLFSRLETNPKADDIKEFWNEVISVEVNQDSGVITFRVRAYTPEMSKNISEEVLRLSERKINEINERARDDSLKIARKEVENSKKEYDNAQQALREFRNLHKDFDLLSTAEGAQALIVSLETEASKCKAELDYKKTYMSEDNIEYKNYSAKCESIDKQIKSQRTKATTVLHGDNSINMLAGEYQLLVTNSEFATSVYQSAKKALETAKLQVSYKSLYIVTIAEPSYPDESLYPRPFVSSFYLFIALSMICLICSVVTAAIREHIGF